MIFRAGKPCVGMSDAGHNKGGDSVVTYAAKYDDVPRIVNVSGRFRMDKGGSCPRLVVSPALTATPCPCCTPDKSVLQCVKHASTECT